MELVLPDRISAKSLAAPLLDCQVGAERHGWCALVLASCPETSENSCWTPSVALPVPAEGLTPVQWCVFLT